MLHTRKTLLIILLCIFIFSSCKKAENPCNLTPEQAPEIRGIRLGMSYDDISEKFRIKCNLNSKDPQRFLHTKIRYSIEIKDADWHNKATVRDDDSKKFDLKGLDTGCFSYSSENQIGFNPSKFPELEGVESLRLSFDEKKLISRIEGDYHSKKPDRKFTIQELIDSLNLSQWTNWNIETDKDGSSYNFKMSRGILLCNNLVIEPEITYFTEHNNMYSVQLDIESVTGDEISFIRNAIVEAKRKEEQKKREAAENSNAATKKIMDEEKRVREPFKP